MINTSSAYKRAIEKNREFRVRDKLTFRDGSFLNLSLGDFLEYKINEATSSSGNFEIGAAVMKEYTVTLSNMDGKFDLYDFEDADIQAVVGLKLEDGTWEDLKKGTYRVFDVVFGDVTLQITAYDGMLFFDRPYSECQLSYPATVLEIIQSACRDCQMTFDASTVEMGDYVVVKRPNDSSLTYRDVVAYCAQIMGSFARIDHLGALSFGWYPFDVVPLGGLDGGIFDGGSPYASGDTAAGGGFSPWNDGDGYDAGSFFNMNQFHHFKNMKAQSIHASDIDVTGLKVVVKGEETEEKSCFVGGEGYVLEIRENPLIQEDTMLQVASQIGRKIIHKPFRPMSVTVQSDPSIEAGDLAVVTTRQQQSYTRVITETTFAMGAAQQVECTAETPAGKAYQRFSAYTKLLDAAKEDSVRQLSSYDIAVQNMNQLAANTLGFYYTAIPQPDGSVLAYRHDKPKLEESKVVYKSGIDGFWVTQDYKGNDADTAWKAGFDSNGNVVLNMLSVIGINFNWARGGTLTLGGEGNGNGVLDIRDESNRQIGKINKDGANFTKGTFSGELKAATGTFSGNLTNTYNGFSLLVSNGGMYVAKLGNSSPHGFVSGTVYNQDNGTYGLRVAGKGAVVISTDILGVSDYYDSGETFKFSAGKSGSVRLVNELEIAEKFGGGLYWDYKFKTLTFEKGIMVTAL